MGTSPSLWPTTCSREGRAQLQEHRSRSRSSSMRVFIIDLFIWRCWVLLAACGIFSCSMWAIVPQPGIEPRPPALGELAESSPPEHQGSPRCSSFYDCPPTGGSKVTRARSIIFQQWCSPAVAGLGALPLSQGILGCQAVPLFTL